MHSGKRLASPISLGVGPLVASTTVTSPVVAIVVVMPGTAVVAASAAMRYPHPLFHIGIVAGTPVALALAAAVVMDAPATIDPGADGHVVVVSAAAAMVVVASVTRTAVMAMMPVVVENRSDDQSAD